jgi:DNA-binding beta-propeller fold protein YncE
MHLESMETPGNHALTFSALIIATFVTLSAIAHAQESSTPQAGLDNQLGMTFSPDGQIAFWVEWNGTWGSRNAGQRVIYTARQENGVWSKPEPAPFTQHYSDESPFISPDGQWLYFVSKRPVNDTEEKLDADIWRYSLVEDGRLEHLSVNSELAEFSPVVTSSGALYFASTRDGGLGEGDIYRARAIEGGFGPVENLGPAINSRSGEWNLWVSDDESELIFEASTRPTNVTVSGDLYYSWRTPAGWTAAVPIESLNTSRSDLMPRLHPDGETLYYTTAPVGGHATIKSTNWGQLRTQLRAAYAPDLLVANRSSHEVTFVDLARGEVVDRIATGAGPHLLSNVSEGRVLATGYGEFPRPHSEAVTSRPPFVESLNSRLTLIDVKNRSVLFDKVVEDCAKPHASWIVAQRGYVTCEEEQQVLAIDLENGQTVDRFDTGQQGSHVLSYAPLSATLAVSNTDSGSLTLIDIGSGETEIVDLPNGSEGSLVLSDQVWVGNAWEGSISIVDIGSAQAMAKIDSVCNFPISLSMGTQEQVWVACFGSAELVAIDSETHAIQRRIELDDQPLNMILHPDRELAYVSLPRKNVVAEIDLDSGKELRRIRVGIEPDGLRWAIAKN